MNFEDQKFVELVEKFTILTQKDIHILTEVSHTLPFVSSLEGGDVYIDILTADNQMAVVVAQYTHPECNFYNRCVVGEIMLRKNEPGVYRTLEIGVPSKGLKAVISDDELIVRQNVSAVMNEDGKVIGALVVEKSVQNQGLTESDYVNDNCVDETIYSGRELLNITEYMNDSVVLFDTQGLCVYANSQAEQLFSGLGYQDALVGLSFENLAFGSYQFQKLIQNRKIEHSEVKIGKYNLIVTCNTVWEKDEFKGAILVIKDTTEIRNKETELILKSAAIDEIHHRVKNNLQTIISLIGLKSNRIDNEEVKLFSRDIISRIHSISLTHEILAQNGVDSIDLKEMLTRMLDSSLNYIAPNELELNMEIVGDEISLQSDTATTIAMIVNELIQNCIKHAFVNRQKGQIIISIEKGTVYSGITITDNGVGFTGKGNSTSLGLKLVRSLVKDKLRGTIEITPLSPGTKIHFTFLCNKNH
ncbi:MAG: histidine kinase N-terminal domain-containing protein [Hungatella sp.]|nr:histidine kinase N-terminal domain-containing protein [Hungatella sp.]